MLRLSLYLFLWISSMGLAIFSNQNIYPVTIKLGFFESIKLPLGLVLIFSAGLGAIAITLLTEISRKTLQSPFPNISQFTNFPNKTSFSKNSTAPKNPSKNPSKNSSKNEKQKPKDDFDDTWDDDWG